MEINENYATIGRKEMKKMKIMQLKRKTKMS